MIHGKGGLGARPGSGLLAVVATLVAWAAAGPAGASETAVSAVTPAASGVGGACVTTGAGPGLAAAPAPDSVGGEALPRGFSVETMEAGSTAPSARGRMVLTYASSPFGVTASASGSEVYRVHLEVARTGGRRVASLVAWGATPELDRVRKLGTLGPDRRLAAQIDWDRFLVFVTAEEDPAVERWQGPILLTGRSPSSRMHTMRGHGIFEAHGIGC